MPGIVGIISKKPPLECTVLARQMTENLRNENFYKSKSLFVPEMGAYVGIVGFENAPDGIFSDEAGKISVLFSGEYFADSEVAAGNKLIRHYEDEGQNFLQNLNGLFCGLLIDRPRKKILLFNDRYGIQRVYFHERAGDFYFASEAKALLRVLPELRQFDPDGLAEFLAFGSTLNWKTLFRRVEIMPGGSLWSFEQGSLRKENYFSHATWESQPPLAPAEFEDRLQQTFKRVLPRYFESPSKIGIALTGGLDTRMIMACRPQNNGHTTCYTFSGNNGRTLDDKIAARVASASNLNHCLLRLEQDFFSDFPAWADKTIWATDGCAGIFNAHEIYLNRKARELAPVRLTGNYGSEILRSHSTFKPLRLSPQLFAAEWRDKMKVQTESSLPEKSNPVSFAAFKEIPWHLYGNLAAGRSQVQFRSPYLDNELVGLAFQTPAPLCKSSMPSFRLVRANDRVLSDIPTDRGFAGANSGPYFMARRAFAEVTFKLDYYTVAGLPGPVSALNPIFKPVVEKLKIAGMHKFVRYSSWFRGELAPHVREVLGSQRVRNSGIWNADFTDHLAAAHEGGRYDYSAEINAVMTLESIERLLFSAS